MKQGRIHARGLSLKLLVPVGLILFASVFIASHFSGKYREKQRIDSAVVQVDKLCNSVLKLTLFAMLHSPSEDMVEILNSVSEYNDIEQIRIFNCRGQVRFSNDPGEVDLFREKGDTACAVCHRRDPPVVVTGINQRVRIFDSPDGQLKLGLITPVLNAPSCSTSDCHYHPPQRKKLGSLEIIVSLEDIRREIAAASTVSFWTGLGLFVVLGLTISASIGFLVTRPISHLILKTQSIGQGDFLPSEPGKSWAEELQQLSRAVDDMGRKIREKQEELNLQKEKYRHLFDQVPCSITVQNDQYELVEFNREFARRFNPEYGDYCYAAYKDLDRKCDNCPVDKTFRDGQSHFSEESGTNKDGSTSHWFVKTAPLKDEGGRVVAAMEMSLDISRIKRLEEEVRISEKKYQAVFRHIPNPVFILDQEDMRILDINHAVQSTYGYSASDLRQHAFQMLFPSGTEYDRVRNNIDTPFHERLVHIKANQDHLYVNIWIRPAEFVDQQVLIVAVVDITVSVEAEQQLIQAGKMATLGEMATGVAHELNQPLSVIKTASSFIARKISTGDPVDPSILETLSREIETHVDRASKITNHMRLFGRKSVFKKEALDINEVLKRGFDIFSQQLKLREIEVIWELNPRLPRLHADPVRLEQVFINLLINARDAIVSQGKKKTGEGYKKQIRLETRWYPPSEPVMENREKLMDREEEGTLKVKIRDTGTGIARANRDKLFEPFFTTKKVGEGTGLGLSISYGIIKESGGEITFHNNKDGGATFILVFRTESGASFSMADRETAPLEEERRTTGGTHESQ